MRTQVRDLLLWPRVGHDNLLIHFDLAGGQTTPFFDRLLAEVMEHKPDLLILDTAADLYGGDENKRPQVNQFIKAVLGHFVVAARVTVLMLAHPSVAGMSSGAGTGGSTAWNNAVRSRWYLNRPEGGLDEQRVLTRKKANYAKAGDNERIDLVWEHGVLALASSPGLVERLERRALKRAILDATEGAWDADKPFTGPQGARPVKRTLPKALDEIPSEVTRAFNELVEDGHVTNRHSNNHQRGYRVDDRPDWA